MIPFLMSLLLTLLTFLSGAAQAAPADLPAPASLDDGTWTFLFPTREGVEGNCRGFRIRDGEDHSFGVYHQGRHADPMEPGPARALVRVRGGRVRSVDLEVGPCAQEVPVAVRDLGMPSGRDAGHWLMAAANSAGDETAEDLVMGACLADGPAPVDGLVAMVRDRSRGGDLRSHALHWMAILAADRLGDEVRGILADDDEDLDLRESAVFALTQLEDDVALGHLLKVGRDHDDPRVRRAALYALSQYDDPSVLSLYEAILAD